MRICLYMPQQIGKQPVHQAYLAQVRDGLAVDRDIEITDRFPDLIHVFGAWNAQALHAVRRAHRLLIPTVYSPLGDLSPWKLREKRCRPFDLSRQKQATRSASCVLVWGELERKAIEQRRWNSHIVVVPNAVITSQITQTDMASRIKELYRNVIDQHDLRMHHNIDGRLAVFGDEAETALCHLFLYLRYRFHRRNILQEDLKRLTDTLNTLEYDEDRLNEMLRTLHEERFAARILQVLADDCGLTEGFMPADPIDDKRTAQIRAAIYTK